MLFYRCTQTNPTFLLMFPHLYTLLPPRVTEGAQSILSLRLSPLFPTTARANCICKFGICVPLPLHPSLHSQVKGSFGCSLSVKSKKGHKVHETKGSNSQLSCNARAQLQKMAQEYSQLKENAAEGPELFVRHLQFNK